MTAADFWDHVQRGAADACWPWLGSKNRSGYGWVRHEGRVQFAHRVAYKLATGATLTPDVVLLHRCDNPQCVNPAHLTPGDQLANRADCVAKGHHACGERNGRAQLTWQAVQRIRDWWARGLATQTELARLHGVSRRAVRYVLAGQHWARVPGKE